MITRDEYKDLVNESYPPVVILGVEYYAGDILMDADPIRFDEMYREWANMQENECEID
jgi:hypothetical protein